MLAGRLFEVRKRGLEGVVGSQDVDVHHGLEGIGRQLVNGGEEVARRTGTARCMSEEARR